MNATRRAELRKIMEQLSDLRGSLSEFATTEQETFENMPEGLQEAEQGQRIEATASELEDATDHLDNCIASIEEAIA